MISGDASLTPNRDVHLVHGIGNLKGAKSVGLFRTELERYGANVREGGYPHHSFWDQRSSRKHEENIEYLLRHMKDGDHVVAHSNGCRVLHGAMKNGAKFGVVYLFGPAMSAHAPWPDHRAEYIRVIHNRHDLAIKGGALLFAHPFGAMGRRGFQGRKPQGYYIDSTSAEQRKSKYDDYVHSHYARDPQLRAMWIREFVTDVNFYAKEGRT